MKVDKMGMAFGIPFIRGRKASYRLTFYLDSIKESDWEGLLGKLCEFQNTLTLRMEFGGRRVHFFVETAKYLENANSAIFPFRFALEESRRPALPGVLRPRPFWLRVVDGLNLFSLASGQCIRRGGRPVKAIILHAVINSHLRKNMGVGRIVYEDGGIDMLIVWNLIKFLSFNIKETPELRIEKVREAPKKSDIEWGERNSAGMLFREGDVHLSISDFDFYRHSLVVGQTGSGKSKFLELYAKALIACGHTKDYSIVFLDPHGEVYGAMPKKGVRNIDFREETVELFTNVGDPAASTELTTALFSELLDLNENPHLMRVVKHSLFLLFSIRKMSLKNLQLLLTDSLARQDFIKETNNNVLKAFFETEFLELNTKRYDTAVLPILNIISEYTLVHEELKKEKEETLSRLLNRYPVVFISMNPSLLGEKITKLVGGSIVQQLFSLLQSKSLKRKVILIVDELRLVQNPALSHIFSEARKYGLTLITAQQYLGQVQPSLLASIKANSINVFCFKVNREDAEVVRKLVNLELDGIFELEKTYAEVEEKKLSLLTDIHPRECVFRVMQKDRFVKPAKAFTVDA